MNISKHMTLLTLILLVLTFTGKANAASSCLQNNSSIYSVSVKYKNGRYGSVAPRTKKCNIAKIRSSGFYQIPYGIVEPWAWTDHLGRVEVNCSTSYSYKGGLNLYVTSAALYYKLRNKPGYTYLKKNPIVYPTFSCGSGVRY